MSVGSTEYWAIVLPIHLLAGFGIGLVYFMSLWWSVGRLATGASVVAIVAVRLVGFMLLAGVLTLAAWGEGAAALLAATAGLVVARTYVKRCVAVVAP